MALFRRIVVGLLLLVVSVISLDEETARNGNGRENEVDGERIGVGSDTDDEDGGGVEDNDTEGEKTDEKKTGKEKTSEEKTEKEKTDNNDSGNDEADGGQNKGDNVRGKPLKAAGLDIEVNKRLGETIFRPQSAILIVFDL